MKSREVPNPEARRQELIEIIAQDVMTLASIDPTSSRAAELRHSLGQLKGELKQIETDMGLYNRAA